MEARDELFYWPTHDLAGLTAVWPEAIGKKNCGDTLSSNMNGGYVSFNYVHQGAIHHREGNKPESLIGEGNAFVILPGQRYSYMADERNTKEPLMFWIRLAGPGAEQFVRAMGMDPDSQLIKIGQTRKLKRLWDRLFILQKKHNGLESDAEAIAVLYDMIPHCDPQSANNEKSEFANSMACRIRNFMFDELERGYNISQISQFFKISRSSLFLYFKREFNESPIAVLKQARLSKAKHLLTETNLSMESISRACGYTSNTHFFHQFKSETGSTPSRYRDHPEGLD